MVAKAGYLTEIDSLCVYSLAGGQVISEYMDGSRDVSLNYEVAIKTQDQQLANDTLWQINDALSDFGLDIPSNNGSYTFSKVVPEKPFINGDDEQGYFVYLLDLAAYIGI